MATTHIIPNLPTSFIYEDLFSKSHAIQAQLTEFETHLNNLCKNQTKIPDELKSRTLVFTDPYGNQTANKYMDHELIHKIIKEYKKNYVPKYLHQWIKIGRMNSGVISALDDSKLKSNVSRYENGYQFITYGEINVWLEINGHFRSQTLIFKALLSDDMNKILEQIRNLRQLSHAELKYCTMNRNAKPNEQLWNRATTLNLNDTILSRQLYQEKCVILAKIKREQVG